MYTLTETTITCNNCQQQFEKSAMGNVEICECKNLKLVKTKSCIWLEELAVERRLRRNIEIH